jgi:hypothetical protein
MMKKKMFGLNRYWLLLISGLFSFILSIVVGIFWQSMPENQLVGMLAVVLFIAGVILIWRQFKHRHEVWGGGVEVNIMQTNMGTAKSGKGVAPTRLSGGDGKPNSIVITATKDEDTGQVMPESIAFANLYKPKGQPVKVLNFNEFYHVQIWNIDKKRYAPLILPDRKFTDPAVMARYLSLPAQRKYLRHRESLMRFVGPGLLAVGVVVGFITIIALS